MQNERTFNKVSFWLVWVLANYAGLGLGLALGYGAGAAVHSMLCNATTGPDSQLPCYARFLYRTLLARFE